MSAKLLFLPLAHERQGRRSDCSAPLLLVPKNRCASDGTHVDMMLAMRQRRFAQEVYRGQQLAAAR